MKLTLFSKPGCHLCRDLRTLLDEVQPEFTFELEEIDITRDADLFSRYRYDIPVLLRDGEEIARGRVSDRELIRFLQPEA